MVGKKGWIRMIEAVVSVGLISGMLFVIFISTQATQTNIQERVYNSEDAILRELQLNNTIRDSIISSTVPVEWDDSGFPSKVKNKINSRTPVFLECEAKICVSGNSCSMQTPPGKEIFVRSVFMAVDSSLSNYNPRQLRLYCWEKSI